MSANSILVVLWSHRISFILCIYIVVHRKKKEEKNRKRSRNYQRIVYQLFLYVFTFWTSICVTGSFRVSANAWVFFILVHLTRKRHKNVPRQLVPSKRRILIKKKKNSDRKLSENNWNFQLERHLVCWTEIRLCVRVLCPSGPIPVAYLVWTH